MPMRKKKTWKQSENLFQEASEVFVGGVNSPVRAFRAVGGHPLFFQRGRGTYLTDVDGNRYLDLVSSWGPLILGHRPLKVENAVRRQLRKVWTLGAPCEAEVRLARQIQKHCPWVEKVRFVSSGTEAVMSAVRLARAVTGRKKIIKFDGCYHGHSDGLLVQAGSGVATLGLPDSPGVPEETTALTLRVSYNDAAEVETTLQTHADVAAILVEPVAGNMGVVPPREGFLEALRALSSRYGCLLIFDEIITGFRVAFGGAAERYGVIPDLVCFGKILGGGFPAAAFAGKKKWMDALAPEGEVYQAGTLSGNPVAMIAGWATLRELSSSVYERLEELGRMLEEGIERLARSAPFPVCFQRVASMGTLFFCSAPVKNWQDASRSDRKLYRSFFHSLLRRGIYLPPSPLEAWFLNAAMEKKHIHRVLNAVQESFQEMQNQF